MLIIFGREQAELAGENYTVLELEPRVIDPMNPESGSIEVFCVISGESIGIHEMPMLSESTRLHSDFIKALQEKDRERCEQLSEHLMGRFGGELDSFYQHVLDRQEL